ncbi:MAG: YbjN domain-containing protein [Alphaproteobacteria bacterium]|nr:YbjN domain-containing protein [Alphaproteobacteria bacterium]
MTSMMILADTLHNPVDAAEMVLMEREWAFERLHDGELLAETSGIWGSYRLWFAWQEEFSGFTLGCAFATKLPKAAWTKMHALIAMVNEKLWLGHFEIDSREHTVAFRHTQLVRDEAGTSARQMQELLDIAVRECERFYPAMQAVVWGGKSPTEALEMALFETIAEA